MLRTRPIARDLRDWAGSLALARTLSPSGRLPSAAGSASRRSRLAGGAPDTSRYGPVVLGAALVVPLLAYAWVGSFSRYTADDYCWAAILGTQGFWQAQVHWYTVYSPRYAFTFLVNLAELAGPPMVPFLPPVAGGGRGAG